jgi:hypothetical protein
MQHFKLKKARGLNGIPNECLRHLPKRTRVHLILSFQLNHFPAPWKEAKFITLPKPGKDLTFPQNLRPIGLLSTTAKLYEKLILRTIQKHTEEINLLNASQFGFRADHSTTLQCMMLADHITLNFNNNMPMGAVFLDMKKKL